MTRSAIMSRIRSTGNRSTELVMASILRRRKMWGWRRHVKVLGIRPDFVFHKLRTVLFVDGCFWHACPVHCKSERLSEYWRSKVFRNHARDIEQTIVLRRNGWGVVRIWEHDLKEKTNAI